MTFAAQDRKTSFTLRTRAVAIATAGRMIEGMEAGWMQSIDRLVAHVARARR